MTPLQEPKVTDVRGLRQASGSGSVDAQRAIKDRGSPILRTSEIEFRRFFELLVDPLNVTSAFTVRPDPNVLRQAARDGIDTVGDLCVDDNVYRRHCPDGMQKGISLEVGVQQG